jgi:hypothetical protein
MKNLLFIPLLFVFNLVIGQVSNTDSIIGEPIRLGKLAIAQNNFPNKMNWTEAAEACEKLGNGWRLPTKKEITNMYKNKDKIGGFVNNLYWSSEECGSDCAWTMSFHNGIQSPHTKLSLELYFRAVRDF